MLLDRVFVPWYYRKEELDWSCGYGPKNMAYKAIEKDGSRARRSGACKP